MIARKQVGVSSGAALGRVVGPVAAGLSGVPDGLRGLQSEDPGEHGRWDLFAELVDGCQPHAAWFDADGAEPLSEVHG